MGDLLEINSGFGGGSAGVEAGHLRVW